MAIGIHHKAMYGSILPNQRWRWRITVQWSVWREAKAARVLLFGSGIGNASSLPPLIAQTEFAAGAPESLWSGPEVFRSQCLGQVATENASLGGSSRNDAGILGWRGDSLHCLINEDLQICSRHLRNSRD